DIFDHRLRTEGSSNLPAKTQAVRGRVFLRHENDKGELLAEGARTKEGHHATVDTSRDTQNCAPTLQLVEYDFANPRGNAVHLGGSIQFQNIGRYSHPSTHSTCPCAIDMPTSETESPLLSLTLTKLVSRAMESRLSGIISSLSISMTYFSSRKETS